MTYSSKAVAQGCCIGLQYIIQVLILLYPPMVLWIMNDRSRFACRCTYYTWGFWYINHKFHDCRSPRCSLPVLQMTNPGSAVCEFHFGSSIKRTVFAQQFPWLWDQAFLWAVKLSGSLTVETLKWEHIQMKQWDMCQQGSVGLRICSDLRGFLTVRQHSLTHMHAHTHTGSRFISNTLWCSLHLSP